MIISSPEMKGFNSTSKTGVVGYGTMYYTFSEAFKKLGHEVTTDPTKGVYLHFLPPQHGEGIAKLYPAQKRYVFTMWESTDIDQKWITGLQNNTEALFVPNEFNKILFSKAGYKKPIFVIPLGINNDFKKPKKRKYTLGQEFRFLHYNAGEPRKGWASLVHSFFEEFEHDSNVKLVVKNSSVHERQLNKATSNLPKHVEKRLEVHRGSYTIEQLINLAYNCHAFVFPAIGEGYGLTPREMLATGMPSLVTNGHSFTELPNWYVKCKTYKARGGFAFRSKWCPVSGLSYISDMYRDLVMEYPDIDHLKYLMRDIYTNYSDYAENAFKDSKKVAKEENTLKSARVLAKVLTKLEG
jgi:hypothetical protein